MSMLGFRGIVWFLTIIVFLGGVLLGMVSAGIHGTKTGDWKPLWESTAGLIAGADNNIEANMGDIIERGEGMDARELRFLQQDIFVSLGVITVMYFLLLRTAKWIKGDAIWNAGWWFFFFMIITIIFILGSIFYVKSVTGDWRFPMGVWKFLNEGIFQGKFWVPGSGFSNPLDISPPDMNISEAINQTIGNITS